MTTARISSSGADHRAKEVSSGTSFISHGRPHISNLLRGHELRESRPSDTSIHARATFPTTMFNEFIWHQQFVHTVRSLWTR